MAGKKKTVKKQVEKAEPKQKGPAIFIASSRAHSVTMRPTEYTFEGGKRRVKKAGHVIQFVAGMYRTEDPKEIEFLRNRPDYGSRISETNRKDYSEKIKEKDIQKIPESDPVVKQEILQAAKKVINTGGIL